MSKALTVQEKNTALVGLLESHKSQIHAALPKHVPVDLLIRSVLTQLRTTPKLLNCTQSSVYLCVMHMAELGLRCGPEHLAYLVPFNRKNKETGKVVVECQLMIGYPGLLQLARQSSLVAGAVVRAVYGEDHFELEYGLEEKLVHRPCITGTRDELVGVYAIAIMSDRMKQFDFMTRDEVEERRKASKSGTSDAWQKWYDEMAKKTVLRRLCKILPSDTVDHLHQALEWDGRADAGKPQHLPPLGGSEMLETQDAPIRIGADPVPDEPEKPAPKPRQPRKSAQKVEDTSQRAKDLATVQGYLADGRVDLAMVRDHAANFGFTGDLREASASVLAKLAKAYADWPVPKPNEKSADAGPEWAREKGDEDTRE